MHEIWTIGHSTRSFQAFVHLLQSAGVVTLVDVRAHPGSRKYPHFNSDNLAVALPQLGIEYLHLPQLGGRRRPQANSKNVAWRNSSFRGYADHMETAEFREGVSQLVHRASQQRMAYMCSEAPWWRCHRALVSDYLKARGWKVWHIMEGGRITEHPFTSPARAVQGDLFYDLEDQA